MKSLLFQAARKLVSVLENPRTPAGSSVITKHPALEEEGKIWSVHNCQNIRVFNDARIFTAYTPDQKLVRELTWQRLPEMDPADYIFREKKYRCKRLRRSALSLFAPHATANYYHWMMDVLPRIHLFQKAFPGVDPDVYLISGPTDLPYKVQTLDLMNIPASKRLGNAHWHHLDCDRIRITDHPQKADHVEAWSCRFLRETFLPHAQKTGTTPGRIYISRSDTKIGRRVLNNDALLSMLAGFDIQPVILSNLSFIQQLSLFAQAEFVVAPHGAGLTNTVFCRPETKVVEIFNSGFSNNCFFHIAKHCGLRRLPASQVPYNKEIPIKTADMVVDIPDLKKKIESLLSN